jgi:tRNA pseudouridine13 synthase
MTIPAERLTFSWHTLASILPPLPPQATLARLEPADFQVEEEPAYLPSGSGDHVMAQVEKTGLSTLEVAKRLAQAVGAHPRDVGFAGRKDVHAVAVQWFTVPRRTRRLPDTLGPGLRILRTALHHNKLKLGHLKSNRFKLLLRAPGPGALAAMRARTLAVAAGVPNYFGPQRFGMHGDNAVDGARILAGVRRGGDPRQSQLLVSALQGFLFNTVASARVVHDPRVMPVEGDLLCKLSAGALFWCDCPSTDGPRVASGELAVTGPLPGSRMRRPRGTALTWESRILEDVALGPTWFTKGPRAPVGDRRTILVRPRDLAVEETPAGLHVSMTLPPGSFATAVLREWAGITKDGEGLSRLEEP